MSRLSRKERLKKEAQRAERSERRAERNKVREAEEMAAAVADAEWLNELSEDDRQYVLAVDKEIVEWFGDENIGFDVPGWIWSVEDQNERRVLYAIAAAGLFRPKSLSEVDGMQLFRRVFPWAPFIAFCRAGGIKTLALLRTLRSLKLRFPDFRCRYERSIEFEFVWFAGAVESAAIEQELDVIDSEECCTQSDDEPEETVS